MGDSYARPPMKPYRITWSDVWRVLGAPEARRTSDPCAIRAQDRAIATLSPVHYSRPMVGGLAALFPLLWCEPALAATLDGAGLGRCPLQECSCRSRRFRSGSAPLGKPPRQDCSGVGCADSPPSPYRWDWFRLRTRSRTRCCAKAQFIADHRTIEQLGASSPEHPSSSQNSARAHCWTGAHSHFPAGATYAGTREQRATPLDR